MKIVLFLMAALAATALAYIRLAPSDPLRWHVDPESAPDPGAGGIRIGPGEITSALEPGALLAAFDAAVRAEPRVEVLAGAPGTDHVTYILRSRVMGFPDYLTAKVLPHDTGSTLVVLSRLRFGSSDMGVNAARLRRILNRMQEVVAKADG